MTMTSGRGPMPSRLSIAERACDSELSVISMFQVTAEIVVPEPPPPLGGGGGGAGVPETTLTYSKFIPPVSKLTVISCEPAPSVTGTLTVVQFCQSPVAGTDTLAQTALE